MTKLRRNGRPATGRRSTKRGYTSEVAARMGAQTLLQAKGCDVDRLWVYRCADCRRWHITSDPRQSTSAVTARAMTEGAA